MAASDQHAQRSPTPPRTAPRIGRARASCRGAHRPPVCTETYVSCRQSGDPGRRPAPRAPNVETRTHHPCYQFRDGDRQGRRAGRTITMSAVGAARPGPCCRPNARVGNHVRYKLATGGRGRPALDETVGQASLGVGCWDRWQRGQTVLGAAEPAYKFDSGRLDHPYWSEEQRCSGSTFVRVHLSGTSRHPHRGTK
jgi:hypothetical protein